MEFLSLGCFNDQNDTRTMHSLESENSTYLKGSYQTREKAVLKCALEAIKMGYKAFAVQDGGACYSGPYAQLNYSVYGVTGCPHGGKGGYLVNEVYLLGGGLTTKAVSYVFEWGQTVEGGRERRKRGRSLPGPCPRSERTPLYIFGWM